VLAEHNANARMLIVHEVMGRNCGWLTAATARKYREWITASEWLPEIGLDSRAWDVHAVFVPEAVIDIPAEAERLKKVMDEVGCVNIFISEGAGVESIVAEMEKAGTEVPRDAFGHIRLDKVNPGAWFGQQFAGMLNAEKTLIQKSGYYARAAAANQFDLDLIRSMTDLAVDCALRGESGVIGHDEEAGDALGAIAFDRIKGGKPFDLDQAWYHELLEAIGQPAPVAAPPAAH
jgi:pyrophosphate--fructose-6-phosphate 1-phosphotransferase